MNVHAHLFVKLTRGKPQLAEQLKQQTLALPDLKGYLGEKAWKELAWEVDQLAVSTTRVQIHEAHRKCSLYMNYAILRN